MSVWAKLFGTQNQVCDFCLAKGISTNSGWERVSKGRKQVWLCPRCVIKAATQKLFQSDDPTAWRTLYEFPVRSLVDSSTHSTTRLRTPGEYADEILDAVTRDTEEKLKVLGAELNNIGGLQLMQAVYYLLRRHPRLQSNTDLTRILALQHVWDGIGEWQS